MSIGQIEEIIESEVQVVTFWNVVHEDMVFFNSGSGQFVGSEMIQTRNYKTEE